MKGNKNISLSIFCFKCIRKIIYPFCKWYQKNQILSGAKRYGTGINVRGTVNLWCANVSLGDIYPNTTFWGDGFIDIGNHVEIGIVTVIYSSSSVQIGDNVNIAAQCYIIDSNHGIVKNDLIRNQRPTIKGDRKSVV